MFSNYIKIAIRNLFKQKAHAFINIFGLAIGLACCLLIILYVTDELNYDNYHDNADRIVRVTSRINFGGSDSHYAVSPAPLAEALENDFPEVVAAARFRNRGSYLVKRSDSDQNFKESRLVFADNSIFDIFSFTMIAGNPQKALVDPNTLVITRSIAEKYFGNETALNKTLILDNRFTYKITGVIEDLPQNSHFRFNFFMAMPGLEESRNGVWLSNNFHTYVLLNDAASVPAFAAKLPGLVEKYVYPQAIQFLNITEEEMLQSDSRVDFYYQPLRDIHLKSALIAEIRPNSDIKYVYIFSAIAFFILLIACINFMNLSTARSARRAREVGIRKVLGSQRRQLIVQFLAESVLISFAALFIALGLVELILPYFNDLANKSLTTPYFNNAAYLAGLFLASGIIGIFAGCYPAFFLSAFRPIAVIKGKLSGGSRSGALRSTLVVFQFGASIFLIISTFVVYNQLNYIQNKNLGFNKEQVLLLHDAYAAGNQLQSLKTEIKGHADVQQVAISSYLPVNSSRSNTSFWPKEKFGQDEAVSMQIWTVDHDYPKTMELQFLQGRDFSIEFPTDSNAIILNERAAKMFNLENGVGDFVSTFAFTRGNSVNRDSSINYHVIGIVKDFHFESMTENIGPLGMRIGRSTGTLSVRFAVSDVSGLVNFIKEKWTTYAAGQPFNYTFLNEQFTQMYYSESRLGRIFAIFAGLAIFIACLGLFGLASFTAEQRTREIGVRKVLGASVTGIVGLFSKEFLTLIGIAFVIACPLAYWVMMQWLVDFEYRTGIGFTIFLFAGIIVTIIALLTVGYQAIKAALTNPVDALKYE